MDIDNILESPKLRLQLSPAELDKKLLEFYKDVTDGPRGDVLRVIGGGQEVAFQDLYIKRRASRSRRNQDVDNSSLSFGPLNDSVEVNDIKPKTASQWVQQALVKNLENSFTAPKSKPNKKNSENDKNNMKMFNPSHKFNSGRVLPITSKSQFCPPRSSTRSFSLLI